MDIVVPSIRLDEKMLLPILALRGPPNVRVHYYVVADDPALVVPAALARRAAMGDVTLLRNERNLGAGRARNRGLEAGSGQLVVFIDDDVVPEPDLLDRYAEAAANDPEGSPGYVGITRFPPPCNAFTHGVVASDMLTFFDIAAARPAISWGVTANLCLRRGSVGQHRFSAHFPREGGGEDINLCLRVLADAGGKSFRCVPDAVVTHPWWSRGRRHYRRFFRWSFGDSVLPTLHPRLRFRGPPTLPEAMLAILPVLAALVAARALPAPLALMVVASIIATEFVVDYAKLLLRGSRAGVRTSIEATLVRVANDFGRLVGHVRAGRMAGLGERFDYFGTGESISYERRVAAAKVAVWICTVSALVTLGR